jgi:hypothetical protein
LLPPRQSRGNSHFGLVQSSFDSFFPALAVEPDEVVNVGAATPLSSGIRVLTLVEDYGLEDITHAGEIEK